ncbi:MAG TPA: DUF6542 domain-containing protein [Jatrophihabitantaceae bacterium]|nr:DUF6542 domain-containing protein [Jatrophihabitantaceae bacterium]
MAEAPAPYGARRPVPSRAPLSDWDGDEWGETRSVRAGSAYEPQPNLDVRSRKRRPAPAVPVRGREREREREQAYERGLPGWGGVLVLIAIAGIGGILDASTGSQIRGGFNYGIVIASFVAILVVRRSGMFPVVVAPPLVYSAGAAGMLYVRSSGGHDKRVLFDAAANWLVYGFPAIAAASAVVLIIAGIRLIVRR